MARKSPKTIFPRSEFRRSYMRTLVAELQRVYDITPAQARAQASVMIDFFQSKVFDGSEIDLGFAVVKPLKVGAREYRMNLSDTPARKFFQGESTRWNFRVHESWQKKRRPPWSKF